MKHAFIFLLLITATQSFSQTAEKEKKFSTRRYNNMPLYEILKNIAAQNNFKLKFNYTPPNNEYRLRGRQTMRQALDILSKSKPFCFSYTIERNTININEYIGGKNNLSREFEIEYSYNDVSATEIIKDLAHANHASLVFIDTLTNKISYMPSLNMFSVSSGLDRLSLGENFTYSSAKDTAFYIYKRSRKCTDILQPNSGLEKLPKEIHPKKGMELTAQYFKYPIVFLKEPRNVTSWYYFRNGSNICEILSFFAYGGDVEYQISNGIIYVYNSDHSWIPRYNEVVAYRVLQEIADHYDFKIVFNHKPKLGVDLNYPTFKNRTIDELLTEVCTASNSKYSIKGDTILIE